MTFLDRYEKSERNKQRTTILICIVVFVLSVVFACNPVKAGLVLDEFDGDGQFARAFASWPVFTTESGTSDVLGNRLLRAEVVPPFDNISWSTTIIGGSIAPPGVLRFEHTNVNTIDPIYGTSIFSVIYSPQNVSLQGYNLFTLEAGEYYNEFLNPQLTVSLEFNGVSVPKSYSGSSLSWNASEFVGVNFTDITEASLEAVLVVDGSNRSVPIYNADFTSLTASVPEPGHVGVVLGVFLTTIRYREHRRK